MSASSLELIASLAKRRGFVFPSSSVYGGLGSTWDYGPLGVDLKRLTYLHNGRRFRLTDVAGNVLKGLLA